MEERPHEIIEKEKEKNIDLRKEIKGKEEKETLLQISPLVLGLASFTISLFLLTEKLTGNTILGIETTTLNYIGSVSFIIALVSLSFYFWKKRHLLEN